MATLKKINAFLKAANAAAWGPPLLFLLLGTGIFLTIQLRALPIRRLFFALRTAFGREARYSGEKTEAGVSPFASLMTELAAEIGTGTVSTKKSITSGFLAGCGEHRPARSFKKNF